MAGDSNRLYASAHTSVNCCCRRPAGTDLAEQPCVDFLHGRFDAPEQFAFGLAAANGKHAMTGNGAERLGEVEIVLEFRFVALLLGQHTALHHALGARDLAHPAANDRIFGNLLGKNVPRALQRSLGGGHLAGLAIHLGKNELGGPDEGGRIIEPSVPQRLGQWREATLTRNHGAGAALRLEWQVQVFQRLLRVCRHDGGLERLVELSLLVDALEDGGAAILHFLEVLGALTHIAKLHLVEPAGHLLAVAGNEWQGGALSEEGERALNLLRVERQFGRHACHEHGGEGIEGRGSHRRGYYVRRTVFWRACVNAVRRVGDAPL
jgi:hypothetical protein